MIRNITVIGSGVMGTGIAISFATKGYDVILNDLNDELLHKAEKRVAADVALLVEEKVLSEKEADTSLNAIGYVTELSQAVQEADLIIEAIPEVIEWKWDLYKQLEELKQPTAIVASNTSTFPITRLMEKCTFANQMVIMHFFNPAHLVPLVEIIKHEQTSDSIVEEVRNIMKEIGKAPVILQKEKSGFIANRLQTALMREAFSLLAEGVATAEDIDTAITAGPGFRWAFTGPIEIADFGGLDTWERVFNNVAPELNDTKEAPAIISDLVAEKKLGVKTGEGIFQYEGEMVSNKLLERDRSFIRLAKMKK
ncbi:3-hydroxyacyl-CoA dehydrogenase family protein [Cytobacillus kochii]|uniref:3-hydroxyacyl-CoA dehydrogenase family protein n=1 Tax=Cytobacillus kochii TaxID=859143 RepID=UPI00203E9F23|nr:3-hydroxyacyl-CoA dehydrogenase family protein [Cytobacillus kochii]MCM3322896.1 3-hydroxyacyl-CoA dehydrogenase family protein [Cytobacillus kochii]MCM3344625.1 3-hydroxyacyl-CoA dehydrogenase family protein [Cytobacillus kochii]